MEVRILGPVEVFHEGSPIALSGGRQRALLALLVLERNRTVTGDRIVEELWNGAAPPTAAKVVQNLVSQLRRELPGDDVLRTRGHGYELALPDDALDAMRFEDLLEQGRGALAAGAPDRAAAVLREALALWRGAALGDLADEPWARTESARLEERRLVAFERRVDADLALGRHADLIGELEAAIAHEPLREGMRAQLMLALYRSGRQAEALTAYADARRTLVAELGIEPGPALAQLHDAILRQDAELDAPPPRRRDTAHRRRRPALLLLGGGMLVAVAAASVLLLAGDDPAAAPAAGTAHLVALDAATGRQTHRIAAGRTPSVVAVHAGTIWAVDAEARTVLRVDPDSGTVDTLATGATPVALAPRDDTIWIANGRARETTQALGPVADEIVGLDAETSRQLTSVALPTGDATAMDAGPAHLAASRDAVWAVTAERSIARLDPAGGDVRTTGRGIRPVAVAAGGAGVWALGFGGVLAQLDERTGVIRRRVRLPTRDPGAVAVGDDAVWVTGASERQLWRVPAHRGEHVGSVDVDAGVTALAAAGDDVWLANAITGTVTGVDGTAMRVRRTIRVGGTPRWLAVDGGTVWVAVTGTAPASTSRDVAGIQPLPASMCEPVLAGPDGHADALVVSDLPLQGDQRLTATQMARAITLVMREHGFRAGGIRLAYQSCDDALAGSGLFDEAKCIANARAYARNPGVIAVIGTLHSGCAARMIPELNRAQNGPVAMLSPVNSAVALTRRRLDPAEVTLAELYPTGIRNYARIYPGDDLAGAALAQLARDRGRQRAFVLDDGDIYSLASVRGFEATAPRLGIEIVGRATWDPSRRGYDRLAEQVARSGANTVLVAGLIQNNAGHVIRDLRERLGARRGSDGARRPRPGGAAVERSRSRGARRLHRAQRSDERSASPARGGVRQALLAHAAGRRGRADDGPRGARGRGRARRRCPIRRHPALRGRRAVRDGCPRRPDRPGPIRRAG